MKLNLQEVLSVISLPGDQRYEYFIKKIADTEEVWGLYHDGWALAETVNNEKVFLVWPAKEYADICAEKDWSAYRGDSFSLSDFIDELLPNLQSDGVLLGVFYTPNEKGVIPTIEQLLGDINDELQNY